jgi:hypothetical protein
MITLLRTFSIRPDRAGLSRGTRNVRQERVLTPKRRPPLSYVSFVVAIATRSLDAAFEARSAATAVPAAQA